MHPSRQIEREYAVRVHGEVTQEQVDIMCTGVELEDGMAKFTDVQFFNGSGTNNWYHVVIMEGRNREVRRLWESQGLQVSRLKRVRYGNVFLETSVRAGTWAELQPIGNVATDWNGVAVSGDGTTLLVGVNKSTGRLYKSTDYGVNWTELRPKGDADGGWYYLDCSDGGGEVIVGDTGIHDPGGSPPGARLYVCVGGEWREERPVGDMDKAWQANAVSFDGSIFYTSHGAGRLYATNSFSASRIACYEEHTHDGGQACWRA
jgi:hypothetical protein